MLATSLRPSNRDLVADARQVFQGNPAPRVLGFRHQPVGNAVVFVRGKPLFLATAFPEQALGRFGAFLLQPLTQFGMALTQAIDLAPRGEDITFDEELAQDVREIITVFSARLYGSRSQKNQKLLDGVKHAVEEPSS